MADAVSPTELAPKYDVTLSDGVSTVGFIVTDGQGKPNPRGIQRGSITRTAIKTYSGKSQYDDQEPPYITIEQSDWQGGRGNADFDKDTSRYYDGYRMVPVADGLVLGPAEVCCTNGLRTAENNWPDFDSGSLNFASMFGSSTYLADSFVAATTNPKTVRFYARKNGNGATGLLVRIFTNNAGVPGTMVTNATATITSIVNIAGVLTATFSTAPTLTPGTTYWLVVSCIGTPDSTNNYAIHIDTSGAGKSSTDGVSWTDYAYGLTWLITEVDVERTGIWFEYKRGWYFVTQPESGGASTLYINGDRGAADSNSGDKTKLIDATKSWTNDEWIGAIAIVIAGPGSEEQQNWRVITDNDATSLTMATWNVAHTTATEYVIVKSKKFISKHTFSYYVTDVTVGGEFVYFAQSEDYAVLRYQEYDASGTWTLRTASEGKAKANRLLAIRPPDSDNLVVYGSVTNHAFYDNCLWVGTVPLGWGDLYYDLAMMCRTDQPFDEQNPISNVTVTCENGAAKISVATGFTTGVIASKVIAAMDITGAKKLGLFIYSTLAIDESDDNMRVEFSSLVNLGGASKYSYVIPDTAANTWTWHVINIDPKNVTGADVGSRGKAIISVGFNLNDDLGAQDIYLWGGIRLISDDLQYINLPNDARVNRLVPYGGDTDDPRKNPWIITESNVYEIQMQNDNAVVALPLDEIGLLRSSDNGKVAGVNDVYLWFNLGRKLQRYYARNMDDFGPDLDEGLPSNRQGDLVAFVSYPGRVFLAVDAGTSGYSSILVYMGNGWHEYYRAPLGKRIKAMGVQNIPGSSTQRLWFTQGGDVLYTYISLDPEHDGDYPPAPEGTIESAMMYAGMKAIYKRWKSLTVVTSRTGLSGDEIYADYRTVIDGSYTEINSTGLLANEFTETEPITTANLAVSMPRSISLGIRLRVRSNSNSNPKIKAFSVDCYGFVPNKRQWNWQSLLSERYEAVNLEQEYDMALGYNELSETALALLDTWADNATPLTMRCRMSVYDNKTVVLNDPVMVALDVDSAAQLEKHIIQISVNEL